MPCRAIANGCRASLLYIYHAKNGGRFDAGFGPGCPVVVMAEETRIEPKPVLLALTYLRLACQTDIPYLFSATVERDETYSGRQCKSVAGKNHAGGYMDGRGKQINGLAGFGGYLNRGRSAKGGIGQERFPLDLAEYVGRDNHRNGTTETQNTDYETIGEATHLVTALGLYPQLILLTRHTTRPSMVQLKPPLHPETWIPFQLSRVVEIT